MYADSCSMIIMFTLSQLNSSSDIHNLENLPLYKLLRVPDVTNKDELVLTSLARFFIYYYYFFKTLLIYLVVTRDL